jgi:predicted nucleic acid-binding Zn ribbon protein
MNGEDPTARGELHDSRRTRAATVAWILAIKLIVLAFGVIAYTVFANKPPVGLYGRLAIWNQWDAPHYLDIARDGYVTEGDQRNWIVFYPLFPWTVRLLAIVFRDYLISAFVVSSVASIGAGILLRRLTELDFGSATAQIAVWFMFIFPTSYFFHIGYTESLFLMLALGSFLAARRRRWWLAGVIGALASLTRVNGMILIPALACEAFMEYRATEKRRFRLAWLWIAFVGIGFAIYLLVNYKVYGHPFDFLTVLPDRFFKKPAWPWIGIIKVWTWLWVDARRALMNGPIEFFFIMFSLGCTIWCWKTLRLSYAVWMTLNWFLFTSTSMVNSIPRYNLILFPIYILLARFTPAHPLWFGIVTTSSVLLMALFIALFVQGEWAY